MNITANSPSSGWSIALGILLIIAGLLSIAVPVFAGVATRTSQDPRTTIAHPGRRNLISVKISERMAVNSVLVQ